MYLLLDQKLILAKRLTIEDDFFFNLERINDDLKQYND